MKKSHRLLNLSRRILQSKWRILRSPMPNENPGALASHQCGPGSNPGVDAIHVCGLSLLFVLVLAPRGFSPCISVFPLLKNKHFQIPFRSGTHKPASQYLIKLRLVTSAKQRQDPCSGKPMDSMNY